MDDNATNFLLLIIYLIIFDFKKMLGIHLLLVLVIALTFGLLSGPPVKWRRWWDFTRDGGVAWPLLVKVSDCQLAHDSLPKTTTSTKTLLRNVIMTATSAVNQYSIRQVGAKNSLEYRAYLLNAAGLVVSPFHDIPLFHDETNGILNMVVEVPRFSNAKLEISKDEFMNPIKQDVKKGVLRYVKNCFPFHGYLWNYGAFPQTWESPSVLDHDTGLKGDNDPIDVIEIGSAVATIGQVKQVKVLGALAMLDEGETDWKVVAIDINDPLASQLNDAEDIDKICPGLLDATRTWFKIYKIPDGKPANNFAFQGAIKNKQFAMQIIHSVNKMWKELLYKVVPAETSDYKISTVSRTIIDSPTVLKSEDEIYIAKDSCDLPDNPIPASVHAWSYVHPHQH